MEKVEEARRVFSNVIHKNHATYISMITVFAKMVESLRHNSCLIERLTKTLFHGTT
jgi:hypothetical protein